MTIAEARDVVRQWSRNARDGSIYEDEDIDLAIKATCELFCRNTRFVKATASASLSDGVNTFTVTADQFAPYRILDAHITTIARPLDVADYRRVHEQGIDDTAEGEPERIGFIDNSGGKVYPTPGSNYTMIITYWKPFTQWSATSSASTTLNLPDDVLHQILPVGPPARLQFTDPEHLYTSAAWKEYLRIEGDFRGGGNLGARSVIRNRETGYDAPKIRRA